MNDKRITTQEVLKILAVGSLVFSSMLAPGLPIAVTGVVKAWKNFNRKDIGRIIKRLQKQQMLSIKEIDGKTIIEITDKGKRRLLEYDFENIELKVKKRDGKWRLIIFDIPENKKHSRDVFVRKLKQLNCIRLQDSVYVSAFPCKNEIDFLCNLLEISDFVSVVSLSKIERGEELIFKGLSQEYLDYIGYDI